MNYAVTLEINT